MAGWKIEYVNGVDLIRIDDDPLVTTGSPVTLFELLENGQLVPGYYDLLFDNVDPEVSADVTIVPPSGNFGRHARTITDVPLTGVWVKDIIYGTRMKFSNAPGFNTNWKTRVHAGGWLGSHTAGNPDGKTLDLREGYGGPADPGWTVGNGVGADAFYAIWKITNSTGQRAADCFAEIVPVPILVPVTGPGLAYAANAQSTALERANLDVEGRLLPYEFTFGNRDDSESPARIDMWLDGELITGNVLLNTDTNELSSSQQIQVGVRHQFVLGDLTGVEITPDPAVANGNHTDLYIYGKRWHELTPDNGTLAPTARRDDGVEDDTLWGTSPVGLTPVGGEVREIQNAESLYLHHRGRIPKGAAFGKNPALMSWIIKAALSTPSPYGG